jgi:hypothetical protein
VQESLTVLLAQDIHSIYWIYYDTPVHSTHILEIGRLPLPVPPNLLQVRFRPVGTASFFRERSNWSVFLFKDWTKSAATTMVDLDLVLCYLGSKSSSAMRTSTFILFFTPIIIGVGLGLLNPWLYTREHQAGAFKLHSTPDDVIEITGLRSNGFYDILIEVDTKSGTSQLIYGTIGSWKGEWELVEEAAQDFYSREDFNCAADMLDPIVLAAGEILQCRELRTVLGEWCPAPELAIALDADRMLWVYEKQQYCTLGGQVLAVLYGLVGTGTGVLFLAIRGIIVQKLSSVNSRSLSS